jgi:hypothetical protein
MERKRTKKKRRGYLLPTEQEMRNDVRRIEEGGGGAVGPDFTADSMKLVFYRRISSSLARIARLKNRRRLLYFCIDIW